VATLVASCTGSQSRKRLRSNSGKLTIALNSGVEGNALRLQIKSYEDLKGISVTVQAAKYAKLYQDEFDDLKTGKGQYDLIMLDDPWFPSFAAGGYLTQIDDSTGKEERPGEVASNTGSPKAGDLQLDDFVDACLKLCRYPDDNGPLYALPYVGNSQLFSYRKDLFDRHNLPPPKTWDDVLNAARTIQTVKNPTDKAEPCSPGNPKTENYGYVMRAKAGNEVVTDFLPILWAYGGDIYDKTGLTPIINNAAAIKALTLMTELGKCSPPNYSTMDAEDINWYLLSGMAAQSVNWPAFCSSYHDDGKWGETTRVTFTVVPSGDYAGVAVIGNWLLAIPKNSQHPEEARKLLVWLTARQQMLDATFLGNPPTRKSVFNERKVQEVNPEFGALLESLQKSNPRPKTPLWPCIEETLGTYLHLASRDDSRRITVEDALNKAQDELKRKLPKGLLTRVRDISDPRCSQQ
jgi:multiple sugar transport system substrate-binding protein